MKKRVTFVEFPVYDNTMPLVSGYLQAYAMQDEKIAAEYDFRFYSRGPHKDEQKMLAELVDHGSDVYAFSCYIWNMALVRRLLEGLLHQLPNSWFLLGGAQVMNHAQEYIPPDTTNVVVCNSEGEQPCYEFLRQLLEDQQDLSQVSGVTYRTADGALVTIDKPPRLGTLEDLPSPFAAGLFDDDVYTFTVLETNRGCPFHCGFCFWGAATNSKVYKFEEKRVTDDIRWIAEHGVTNILIADANWGLSPRDVELSRQFVRCNKEFGAPTAVTFSAAKNRPDRVTEIAEILADGGLVSSQPISLQTVNSESLKLVDRSNIREETYTDLQRSLNEKNINSFIEMIWPLPGETLESFKAGIARLCRLDANTLTIYPQLLLHNTSLYDQQEVMGIEVDRALDRDAEADIVVATRWVNRLQCEEGNWIIYMVQSLHNARGTYYLSRYLDQTGIQSYEDFFTEAVAFCQQSEDDLCRFFASSVATATNYDMMNIGKTAHFVLHSQRQPFDRLLMQFARTQDWWSDRRARCALDLDLVARPYIYREPAREPGVALSEAHLLSIDDSGLTISLPDSLADLPFELGFLPKGAPRSSVLRVEHPTEGKIPVARHHTVEQSAGYCYLMIQRLRTLLPTCRPLELAAGRAS